MRDYIKRFNYAMLEVPMKKGLRAFRFTFSLDKKYSINYSELLVRAQKYAQVEEQALSQRQVEKESRPSKKKAKEDEFRPLGV